METRLANGLVIGHAYSITRVLEVWWAYYHFFPFFPSFLIVTFCRLFNALEVSTVKFFESSGYKESQTNIKSKILTSHFT